MSGVPARYHLMEVQRPPAGWHELQALAEKARAAATEIDSEDEPVRFLRAIFLPEDGTCFHLFEGTDAAVAEASSRTQTAYRRTVASWGGVAPSAGQPVSREETR
jgi:hypothetical protein